MCQAIGFDPAVTTVLGICALIAAVWCFIDMARAIDERDARASHERPGPNDRRK